MLKKPAAMLEGTEEPSDVQRLTPRTRKFALWLEREIQDELKNKEGDEDDGRCCGHKWVGGGYEWCKRVATVPPNGPRACCWACERHERHTPDCNARNYTEWMRHDYEDAYVKLTRERLHRLMGRGGKSGTKYLEEENKFLGFDRLTLEKKIEQWIRTEMQMEKEKENEKEKEKVAASC